MSDESNNGMPMWFNGAFILTMVGLLGGGGGACLTYFLKSRCKKIKCCCISCERDVVALTVDDVEILDASRRGPSSH